MSIIVPVGATEPCPSLSAVFTALNSLDDLYEQPPNNCWSSLNASMPFDHVEVGLTDMRRESGPALHLAGSGVSLSVTGSGADTGLDCEGGIGVRLQGDFGTDGVRLSNLSLVNCDAGDQAGGALWVDGTAVELEDVVVSGCKASVGGGVYVSASPSVIMRGCSFSDNMSLLQGGAAYIFYSTFQAYDSHFHANEANFGGGLFMAYSTVTLTGVTMTEHNVIEWERESSGGAFYALEGTLDIIGCEFSSNGAIFGGAGYVDSAVTHMTDTVFADNESDDEAGCVFMTKTGLTGQRSSIARTNFTRNTASKGAALSLKVIVLMDVIDCRFEDMVTEEFLIYAKDGSELSVYNSVFQNNVGEATGAMIYTKDSKVEIHDSVFRNIEGQAEVDLAEEDPVWLYGVLTLEESDLNMTNTVFRDNINTPSVAFVEGTGVISDCQFIDNTAIYGAGVAVILESEDVTLRSVTFSNNHADVSGGAVYIDNDPSQITLEECQFLENDAGVSGGAIFFANAELLLEAGGVSQDEYCVGACVFDGNTATTAELFASSAYSLNVTGLPERVAPLEEFQFQVQLQDSFGQIVVDAEATVLVVLEKDGSAEGDFRVVFQKASLTEGVVDMKASVLGPMDTLFHLHVESSTGGVTFQEIPLLVRSCDVLEEVAQLYPSDGIMYQRCMASGIDLVSGSARTAVHVITYLLMALSLMAAAFLFHFRTSSVMKASSPQFVAVMVVGSLVSYLSVIFMNPHVDEDGTHSDRFSHWNCVAFPWIAGVAYMTVLGALLSKEWRIMRIFKSADTLESVEITNVHLALRVLALVVLENAFQLAQYLSIDAYTDLVVADESESLDRVFQCAGTDMGTWRWVGVAYKSVLLLYGVYLALMIRDVPERFNESQHLGFAIYNMALCGLVAFPLLEVVNGATTVYVIGAVGVLLATTVTTGIILIPKVTKALLPTTTRSSRWTTSWSGNPKSASRSWGAARPKRAPVSNSSSLPSTQDEGEAPRYVPTPTARTLTTRSQTTAGGDADSEHSLSSYEPSTECSHVGAGAGVEMTEAGVAKHAAEDISVIEAMQTRIGVLESRNTELKHSLKHDTDTDMDDVTHARHSSECSVSISES